MLDCIQTRIVSEKYMCTYTFFFIFIVVLRLYTEHYTDNTMTITDFYALTTHGFGGLAKQK